MLSYLIRRLLGAIGLFLLISYAIWLFTTATGYTAFRHLTLSTLLPASYLLWLGRVLHGDLGYSVKESEPVLAAIQSHLLATILLVIPAFLLQQVLAIGVGVSAGIRPRSWFDRLVVGVSTMLVAIPPFWLALLAVSVAIVTQALPAFDISNLYLSGYAFNSPGYWQFFAANRGEAILDIARHLLLPVGVLAVLGAAGDGLFVRQRMMEVMQTDYIRAARAHGLPQRVVRWQHGLRNALLPILTNVTNQLPQLVFAAAIVEFVFQLPGAGGLFARSVYIPPDTPGRLANTIDYALLTGILLFFAAVTLLSSLFTDVLYAMADPRIRVGGASAGFVENPLRSKKTLTHVGPLTVRTGPVLTAALVALGVVIVGATINELRQAYAPVVADWSGTMVVDEVLQGGIQQPITLPSLLHLNVAADGKIQGQFQGCQSDGLGNVTYLIVNLTGETDNLTYITIMGSNHNPSGFVLSGLYMTGSYAGKQGVLDLSGNASDSATSYSASLNMSPGGSLPQLQQICAQKHSS